MGNPILRHNSQKKALLGQQNRIFLEQVLRSSAQAKSYNHQISSDTDNHTDQKPPQNTFKLFKPKLIIFDKYGTLIDFHSTWTPWLQTLADRWIPIIFIYVMLISCDMQFRQQLHNKNDNTSYFLFGHPPWVLQSVIYGPYLNHWTWLAMLYFKNDLRKCSYLYFFGFLYNILQAWGLHRAEDKRWSLCWVRCLQVHWKDSPWIVIDWNNFTNKECCKWSRIIQTIKVFK